MEMAEVENEVAQEYASSLADLQVNSKPLINMLTILAEENIHHASAIVQAVEKHLLKVAPEYKLPVLYLIDSIVKNVGRAYTNLFTQNIVSTFCGVFEKVDERTRGQMFKLRHTWNEMFPAKKLYAMDLRVASIDPAWPVPQASSSIHINPRFLSKKADDAAPVVVLTSTAAGSTSTETPSRTTPSTPSVSFVKSAASELEQSRLMEARMREELLRKQKELLELQQKKIELELLQAKTKLEEQQRQMLLDATALADPAKTQQQLEAKQSTAARVLAEQKAKAALTATVSKPQPPPMTAQKTHSQVPQTSDAALKSIVQQRIVTDSRIPKTVTSDNSYSMLPNVLADSKPKPTLIKPTASVSTNNKDIKAGTKDTFLNIDPRIANKRISPVPKSMAMLATASKDRQSKVSHIQDNFSALKPSLPKQKTTSPTKSKKSPSPMKVIPETSESTNPVIISSSVPVGIVNSHSSLNEAKLARESDSSKSSSGSPKKTKILKKGPVASNPIKSENLSPKVERRKIPKYTDPSEKRISKSHKEHLKPVVKDIKKGLESKKKDRKRVSESVSGGKSAGSKSKSDVKSGRVFKDIKSCRSRNYMRRNRSVSESPEPPSESGDVDLRSGPPDKIARISLFADDPDALSAKPGISPPFQLEGNLMSTPTLIPSADIVGKDVDLRQLPTSPVPLGKKRASSVEKSDHPSPKKSKAEMIDVLFGNEDVDLRQLAPPPMELQTEEAKERKKAPDWARFKEVNPDTYRSPLKNSTWETTSEHGSHVSDLDLPAPPPPPKLNNSAESPSLCRTSPLSRSNSNSKEKPAFDRLGRPLLYNHRASVDDPRERRRSLSSQSTGEDTDMRQAFIDREANEDTDTGPMNINIIIAQADEQLKNGTISIGQYNTLLKQMVHLNEVQKMREAQRRDEQEGWDHSGSDSWDQVGSKSDDDRDSDRSREDRESPRRDNMYRRYKDDESEGSSRYSKSGGAEEKFGHHGDIDERLVPMAPGMRDGPHQQQPRGRGMPPRGGGPPHPSRGGLMPRPWPENCGPGGPGPRPQWEEPGWPGGQHPHQMGPRPPGPPGPPLPPGPGMVPHHMSGPRPHFGRGRGTAGGEFGPRFQWQQQQQEHFNQAGPPGGPPIGPPVGPPVGPGGQFPFNNGEQGRFPPRPHFRGELPPVDPRDLEMLDQDSMKTISIDGIGREIRYYGDTAIIMMKWDDPRELSFHAGTRRITFNDCESILCNFGDKYRDFMIGGEMHSIRLGAPTRELFIDGRWYECYFGGPPITVELNGKRHRVQLEGPPPQVKVGNTRRIDLVAGKINLIIDAQPMAPVFLDPKPQKFVIDGKPHIMRFIEAFRTVLINGRPFRVNFGGLPMPIMVHNVKHFVGFSLLPPGIRPGYISITNMEGGRLPTPPPEEEAAVAVPPFEQDFSANQPAMPMIGSAARGRGRHFGGNRNPPGNNQQMRNNPHQQQTHGQRQPYRHPQQGQLDVLSSIMPGAVTPATGFSYQVHQEAQQPGTEKKQAETTAAAAETKTGSSSTSATPSLNIGELLQKLVATGILSTGDAAETKREEDTKAVKPVTFTPESLKTRQAGIFTVLYSGIQCSSCGVRFPPEQTMKYSQHLDWHFRQNRRDRDSAKKAQSRKWYYDVSDWIQFEEIEDLEERAQSWFETQVVERPEEREQELLSVAAGDNSEEVRCAMCHEGFEQFYNEDKEEWHLRDAIRVDDKTYHPVCYEDYKKSIETSLDESMVQSESQETEAVKTEGDVKTEQEVKKEPAGSPSATPNAEENPSEGTPPTDATVVKEESSSVTVKEEPMDTEEGVAQDTPSSEKVEIKTDEETKTISDIVIKTEPIDIDDSEQSSSLGATMADTTLNIVTSSIDGNVELEETASVSVATGKIKINISKIVVATPVVPPAAPADSDDSDSDSDEEQVDESERESSSAPSLTVVAPAGSEDEDDDAPPPPPPGEDTLHLKPRLVGRKLTELPPVFKGTELSGLCSIM